MSGDTVSQRLWKNRFRLSFWSVGLIMLYVIIGILVYFWEPMLASLFFLGSGLSFSVGYFLGACIEQFGFRGKLLLVLSLSFLLLSVLMYICHWYFYAIDRTVSPVPYVVMSAAFWLPVYLLSAYSLVRTYFRKGIRESG